MKTISVHEAKTHLSALLARVEDRHERITICRYGRAVAELAPVQRGRRTKVDKSLCNVTIHDDLTKPTVGEWEDA